MTTRAAAPRHGPRRAARCRCRFGHHVRRHPVARAYQPRAGDFDASVSVAGRSRRAARIRDPGDRALRVPASRLGRATGARVALLVRRRAAPPASVELACSASVGRSSTRQRSGPRSPTAPTACCMSARPGVRIRRSAGTAALACRMPRASSLHASTRRGEIGIGYSGCTCAGSVPLGSCSTAGTISRTSA